MKWLALGAVLLFWQWQDNSSKPLPDKKKSEKKIEETVIFEIPEFYIQFLAALDSHGEILLNPPPSDVDRKYFVRYVTPEGKAYKAVTEFEEKEFYAFITKILEYGVLDDSKPSYPLNIGYQKLVRALVFYNIVSVDTLKKYGAIYLSESRNWVESAYYLDEAFPGCIRQMSWSRSLDRIGGFYFKVLLKIKSGDSVKEIRDWLDNIVSNTNPHLEQDLFLSFAKSYGELIHKGAVLSDEIENKLFASCLKNFNSSSELFGRVKNFYILAGLPLPKKSIIANELIDWLDKLTEPVAQAVVEFRSFRVEFPKEKAKIYRDVCLQEFIDLESILYIIKIAGEDADPKLWKKYADRAFHWHQSKENRKIQEDNEDCYHAAVEGYRRAIAGGVPIDKERLMELVKLGEEDLSLRLRDLIIAYELAGHSTKSDFFVEKFEERIEKKKKLESGSGAYYKYIQLKIYWHTDELGSKIVPFQDEIELAAYLGNPERTRELSCEIARYATERLKREGLEIYSCLKDAECLVFLMAMRNLNTPVYWELEAILDIYENLGFKIGARSLAHELHEKGFELPARRAYHLGGLGKEAETKLYEKQSLEYWQQKQMIFSFIVRRESILKKKNK